MRRRDLCAETIFLPALPRVERKVEKNLLKIAESRKDRVGASEPVFGNDEEEDGARPPGLDLGRGIVSHVPVSNAMRVRTPEYKRRERESEGIRKRRDPGDAPRPETKQSTSNRRNRPDPRWRSRAPSHA